MSQLPALNAEQHRKLNNGRSELLCMNLQPAIRKWDIEAINSGVRVLVHHAKLNGCYALTKNESAVDKLATSPITALLAEIGPIDNDDEEKKAE
jgi:hypothetical protein